MESVFQPSDPRNGLEAASDELLRQLQSENPNMRASGGRSRISVGGVPGISVQLTNESPAGGTEVDWLVSALRPEGLVYFVFVAPQGDFPAYRPVFEQMLSSIHFQ